MNYSRFSKMASAIALASGLAAVAYFTSEVWLPFLVSASPPSSNESHTANPDAANPKAKVMLSDQNIENLGLVAKSERPQSFWKTISVPGMVIDRPGKSDRGIVAPVTGEVTAIFHVPGDTVRPGEVLFTLKLLSESLHLTQTELLKSIQELKAAELQKQRLASSGSAIPESRILEVDQQIGRLQIYIRAYRQDLLTRGLSLEKVEEVTQGKFVKEISIAVPPFLEKNKDQVCELQELKVELGLQVQAGQTLCLLSNHQFLNIEGRAFRDETPLLERSVKEGWPVEVDFQEDPAAGWSGVGQTFFIRHLSNTIDPVNRTFAFQMPLENQSRVVEQESRTQMLWRFRPGQKVRLLIRVGKIDDVFVVPTDAVIRDGAEAYVFTQNVNTFERVSVKIVSQTRQLTVLANDGSIVPGAFVAQNGAAQLNRIAKAQSNSTPKGYHVHADGSLHKNEDEGK